MLLRTSTLLASALALATVGLFSGPSCAGEEEADLTQAIQASTAASPANYVSSTTCRLVSDPYNVLQGGRIVFAPTNNIYVFEPAYSMTFPGYWGTVIVDCGYGNITNPTISRTASPGGSYEAILQSICSQPSYSWGMATADCQQRSNNSGSSSRIVGWECNYYCGGLIHYTRNVDWPTRDWTNTRWETKKVPTPGNEYASANESAFAEGENAKAECCNMASVKATSTLGIATNAVQLKYPDAYNIHFDWNACAGSYNTCIAGARARYGSSPSPYAGF